jgi:hypothetical protein
MEKLPSNVPHQASVSTPDARCSGRPVSKLEREPLEKGAAAPPVFYDGGILRFID